MINLVSCVKPAGVSVFSVNEKQLKLLPEMCLESRLAAIGVNVGAALSQYKSKKALPAIAALPAHTVTEWFRDWFVANQPAIAGSQFRCVARLLCVAMGHEPSSVEASVELAMNHLDKHKKAFKVMSWPFQFPVCAPTLCDAQAAVATEMRKDKVAWYKPPTKDFIAAVEAATCGRVSVQPEAALVAPGPGAVRCPPSAQGDVSAAVPLLGLPAFFVVAWEAMRVLRVRGCEGLRV
jgi:hypothetical protein